MGTAKKTGLAGGVDRQRGTAFGKIDDKPHGRPVKHRVVALGGEPKRQIGDDLITAWHRKRPDIKQFIQRFFAAEQVLMFQGVNLAPVPLGNDRSQLFFQIPIQGI